MGNTSHMLIPGIEHSAFWLLWARWVAIPKMWWSKTDYSIVKPTTTVEQLLKGVDQVSILDA